MNTLRLTLLSLAAATAMSAQAASYNFDVLYNGGNVGILGGGDNPVGQQINIDDSFIWSITAINGGEWQVQQSNGYFPLMAFHAQESGARYANWTLTLSNNGVDVFTAMSDDGSVQRYIHMGTNTINLTAGLVFDRMVLDYTLTDFVLEAPSAAPNMTTDTNVIQGLLPIFGAPEFNQFSPGIVYVPVPEPGTYALLAIGLAGIGLVARRRRTAA